MSTLTKTKRSGTGRVLELSVLPALDHGGYEYEEQVVIGLNVAGATQKVDIVATSGLAEVFLVSLKWQQVIGTAEQKVPFEVICLKNAVLCSGGQYKRAYLILGGYGAWTLRDYYMSDEFERDLPHRDVVTILGLEEFMALANTGRL